MLGIFNVLYSYLKPSTLKTQNHGSDTVSKFLKLDSS